MGYKNLLKMEEAPSKSKSENKSRETISEEEFKAFVKKTVRQEVKDVFKSLADDGVQAGRLQISKSRNKIIKKVIAGDKGRHRTDEQNVEKMKSFVKSYLIHEYMSNN